MSFELALLCAGLVTVVPTVLNLTHGKIAATLAGAAISIVVITAICWITFYFAQPVVGLSLTSYYQNWWGWLAGLVIATVITTVCTWTASQDDLPIGSVAAVVVVILFAVIGLGSHVMWTKDGAQQLVETVNVKQEPLGSYPDSDANHIVTVPEDVALKTARNALNSSGATLATVFELYGPTLQSVSNHAYWIVPMRPRGTSENNSVNGVAPGYIVVDAENPDTPARLQETDASGKKLAIRYIAGGYGDYDLARYLWSNGYAGTPLDDMTLEVNDQWQPFWTVSTNKLTLRFNETIPDGLLIVDAQTGAIQHKQLNQLPAWVDRVYSASTVTTMLNWWGDLKKGDYSLGGIGRNTADRYKVADGEEPTLVYTKEGYPAWQVELTSLNNDNSVSYVALFSGRSNTVRLYSIPDVQIENGIVSLVTASNTNPQKIEPQHLATHKMYGRLTWVGTMVRDGNMQGIALVPADAKPNAGTVVIAPTMSQALNSYRTMLSSDGNAKPGESVQLSEFSGTVVRVSSPLTEAGKTVYYFTLEGSSNLYRVVFDPLAESSQLEVPFIRVGSHVTVKYQDVGGTRRDVVSYDDKDLQLK